MQTNKTISITVPTPQEEIIEMLESCNLCGSKLKFKHQTDYIKLLVLEEAMCIDCGIKNKVETHGLQ